MILDVRPLTPRAVAPGLFFSSKVQHVSQIRCNRQSRTVMAVTQGSIDPPATSWKPPWEARRDTIGALADGEYDTVGMDEFFGLRPERAWARVAQILFEILGVLLALAADQLVRSASSSSSSSSNNNANNTGTTNTHAAAGVETDEAGRTGVGGAPLHIRRAVTRLGPNFVKIGQALASRPDLVGEAIAGELLLLQDAMPLFPNEVAREFIREELGAYPEEMFDSMEENPVAAASLGQVYKAQVDGRSVAVKVQRPDLLEAVGLDFYVARAVARIITRLSSSPGFFGGRLVVRSDLVAAVDEYGSRLFEELDYRKEADNMVRFKELYGAMPGIVVPEVLLEYSGKRVITSEWIEGEKLVDDQAQVSSADLPILRIGIECTLTQLLDKGFLHADPHGGNLLKTADKRLAYLDFGLVSVIPPGVMDALICATVYVMNRDYVALAKGFPALALMSESDLSEDFGPFAEALEAALDPIIADFRQQMGLDGALDQDEAPSWSERVAFAQLIDRVFLLARSFNFVVPPYFISNVRALGELEGLAMTADPGFNLISVVYPYVCRRLLTDPNPSLQAALEDLVVTDDGSIQWEVLEALMRDSNFLDQRIGPGGETRRPPLDLSLEFILSKEGTFLRSAVLSDLKVAAASSVRSKVSRVSRRKRQRQGGGEGGGGGGGGGGADREAQAVSRRLLRRRALKGARRRPLVVFRIAAAVLAAGGRRISTAFVGAFRRLLSRRQGGSPAGA